MNHFTDLAVWEQAHGLTRMIYIETRCWPKEELFGLTSQIRRSASSVGANIAEGWGRFNDKEFHHFCNIARGSLAETENHLLLAMDLEYCAADRRQLIQDQIRSVSRLLNAFMKRLRPD